VYADHRAIGKLDAYRKSKALGFQHRSLRDVSALYSDTIFQLWRDLDGWLLICEVMNVDHV